MYGYQHQFGVRIYFILVSQAFDQHLNLILGDVDETITVTEIDEETEEQMTKVSELLYQFSDSV